MKSFDEYLSSSDSSLVADYPEAKVLLTMRSAQSRWNSFKSTILKYIKSHDDPNGFDQLLVADQVFEGQPDVRDHAIAIYNRSVEQGIAANELKQVLRRSVEFTGHFCRS